MPGGRGKAVRACQMCKPYKRAGNTGAEDQRRPVNERRNYPGTSKAQRREAAWKRLAEG